MTDAAVRDIAADLLAAPFDGTLPAGLAQLDEELGGPLAELVATKEASAVPGAISVVRARSTDGLAARRLALAGIGGSGELDEDTLRAGAAGAAGRCAASAARSSGWSQPTLALPAEVQVRAVVEGALLGDHDPARWKTSAPLVRAERLVIAGAGADLQQVADRAEVVARWTNRARELVDGPPNEVTPVGLADRDGGAARRAPGAGRGARARRARARRAALAA